MFGAIDDGDWRPPVSLTRDQPVPNSVADRSFADALFSQVIGRGFDRAFLGGAGQRPRVDHRPVSHNRFLHCGAVERPTIRRLNDRPNFQSVISGEFKISWIVSGHGHNGAGAITHQDIVRYPDRDTFIVNWIDCVSAGKGPGLFLV